MQLGKYETIEEIGRGRFGTVYKVYDSVMNEVRAIKVLHPQLAVDPDFAKLFIRKAHLLARLSHPNLMKIADSGVIDGHYYIVMEFIDGKPLNTIIKDEGPLSWEQALDVINQIGGALAIVHAQGLVHADVSPQNIIISAEGAVLTDFGLVNVYSDRVNIITRLCLFTPGYVAPEIWEGDDASPASDQYAFACVVYEMLTGQSLFHEKTLTATISRQLTFSEYDLEKVWPAHLSLGIKIVLAKALSIEPGKRYRDMTTFIEALTQARENNKSDPISQNVPGSDENLEQIKKVKKMDLFDWIEIPGGEVMSVDFSKGLVVQNLPAYRISKYPVTNAQYKLFLDANSQVKPPYYWEWPKNIYSKWASEKDNPVIDVDFDDAQAFCEWAGYRLPTHAELEKAFRYLEMRSGTEIDESQSPGIHDPSSSNTQSEAVSPENMFYNLFDSWEWTSTKSDNSRILWRASKSVQQSLASVRDDFKISPMDPDFCTGFRCVTTNLD